MLSFKKLCILLLLSICLYSMSDDYWIHKEEITLEKDEFHTVWVYRDKGTDKQYKKILYFRWTLFHNHLLTMHLNLEKFNHQFNLKQDFHKRTFKLSLFNDAISQEDPFFILSFKSFDLNSSKATFEFLIRDEFGSIGVEKLK